MAMADVTIKGAGIFGLSIAWVCAKRGARVQVIDPGGVAPGSSGGIVGALAPHTPENWNDKKQFQFDSLMSAELFWREVEAASGAQVGYARSGRLQPLADEWAIELALTRQEQARSLWQGRARFDVVDAAEAGDWAPQSATGKLVHDTLSARIHPRQACLALAKAVMAKGGTIAETGQDSGKVVDATGWHGLLELSREMDQPLGNGVKGQAALLDFNAPEGAPQLFADALHIVPHANGTVAIGSTSEREFEDPQSTDALLETVLERARAAFPILADAPVLQRWAGVRPRAKSRAPMLGHHPTKPGQFIANGGFKIGFGMAPKMAEIMADLVLDGVDAIPPDFTPDASIRRG
ncbi:MAG: FAD-binding oxidoreductase [Pseudomonadota bacterium]